MKASRFPGLIPLRDLAVALDLQALVNEACLRARYDRLDCTSNPELRLSVEDSTWAQELLRVGK